MFAKDQRVTQTTVVENKRRGHALSLVQARQDRKREIKVLTTAKMMNDRDLQRAKMRTDQQTTEPAGRVRKGAEVMAEFRP